MIDDGIKKYEKLAFCPGFGMPPNTQKKFVLKPFSALNPTLEVLLPGTNAFT
jgi:hypothetical protein